MTPSGTVTFTFGALVPVDELRETLALARMGVEALHGPERVRLEAPAAFDAGNRAVRVRADTEVGRALAALFLGYARREFGSGAVTVVGDGGVA